MRKAICRKLIMFDGFRPNGYQHRNQRQVLHLLHYTIFFFMICLKLSINRLKECFKLFWSPKTIKIETSVENDVGNIILSSITNLSHNPKFNTDLLNSQKIDFPGLFFENKKTVTDVVWRDLQDEMGPGPSNLSQKIVFDVLRALCWTRGCVKKHPKSSKT